jgi:hypothetical protein
MECLISDKRFAGHQYLEFDLRERDGCCVFGPANGSLWWQINQERVGADHVLLGLVAFLDEYLASWLFLTNRIIRRACRAKASTVSCIQVVIANIESIAWTVVLPIRHNLGRVPLMRLYLAESVQPTIPHSLAGDKDPYFEHGCADRAGRSGIGSGSRLFEINVHLWQYGRPQPRTMSVQERPFRTT